jgi:hypothetical protein
MRYLAFILAIHFTVFCTQPAWQPLGEWLFGGACSGICDASMACPAPSNEDEKDGDDAPEGCCLPFQCCYPCCCFVNQPYTLTFGEITSINIRPSLKTEKLRSQFTADYFQPPERHLFV